MQVVGADAVQEGVQVGLLVCHTLQYRVEMRSEFEGCQHLHGVGLCERFVKLELSCTFFIYGDQSLIKEQLARNIPRKVLGDLDLIYVVLLVPVVQVTIEHEHLFDLAAELYDRLHAHVVVADKMCPFRVVYDLVRPLERDHFHALKLVELFVPAPEHDALDVLLHRQVQIVRVSEPHLHLVQGVLPQGELLGEGPPCALGEGVGAAQRRAVLIEE